MNNRPVCFFLCLIALHLISTVSAQDQLTTRTNYYNFTGSDFREIREAMARARPNRILHDAQTDWHIEWKFTTSPANDTCSIKTLTVRTAITTTLPRWVAPPNSSPELLSRWKQYMTALEKHEAHHRMIAEEAARALRKEIPRTTGPCNAMQETVNTAAERILAEYKKRQADYDFKTEHGMAEGARFP